MIDLISVDNMRQSDAATIAAGTPGRVLMQRAALGIFRSTDKWGTSGTVNIVTGSGNNGGDGFALAAVLAGKGIPVKVLTLSDKVSDDASYYRSECVRAGVDIVPFDGAFSEDCGIIADCLLGTGFKGTPRENYASAIRAVNERRSAGVYVVSADINSGMNGDTGGFECCVVSDLTVAIGYIKKGQISPSALSVTGSLIVADIGIDLVCTEDKIDEKEYGISVLHAR